MDEGSLTLYMAYGSNRYLELDVSLDVAQSK